MNRFELDRQFLLNKGCSEEEADRALTELRKASGFMDCRVCPECYSSLFRTVSIEEGLGFCTYTCTACNVLVGSRAEGEGQC